MSILQQRGCTLRKKKKDTMVGESSVVFMWVGCAGEVTSTSKPDTSRRKRPGHLSKGIMQTEPSDKLYLAPADNPSYNHDLAPSDSLAYSLEEIFVRNILSLQCN